MSQEPVTQTPSTAAEQAPYRLAVATLSWGFRIGATLLALGLLLALIRGEPLSRRVAPPPEIITAIRAGHASGLIDLAIVWMIGVPIATTLAVAGSFLRLGDHRYALLCAAVVAILGLSIVLAL